MSLILSAPRRVYVLLLFWQRVNPWSGHALLRTERTIGVDSPGDGHSLCHVVAAVRWQRILWRRFVGLSFLILDSQASSVAERGAR